MKKFLLIPFLLFFFTGIRAQVTAVSSNTISMNVNGSTLRIPYYRNLALTSGSTAVTHAVIMIHGTDRNADDYYTTLSDVAQLAGKASSSLLIAPQFLMEEDVDAHNLNNEYLFWNNDGWKNGSNSLSTSSNPRTASISSYAVLDTIILRISKNFPNLKSIYVAGHSAGGQVVSRYVAANGINQSLTQCMRYIVANPSSYLYFDGKRKVNGTSNQFVTPTASEITACPDYNDWKYGFGNLQTDCPYAYTKGNAAMITQFQQRETVFMAGGSDNDPNSSSLDKSCAGMMQGDHRFERANIYYNYIKNYFGNSITGNHVLDTVPGVAHNNHDMFTSAEGVKYLFGSICTPVTTFLNESPKPGIRISAGNKAGTLLIQSEKQVTAEVYSLSGQLLMRKECSGETLLHLPGLSTQLLIVRIYNADSILSKKISWIN